MTPGSPNDDHLLRRWIHGDREAFDALYRRYAPRVYATALRLTGRPEEAEDTLQDVFLQLARKAASVRTGAALPAWLYRATMNRAFDLLRRRRPMVALDAEPAAAARMIDLVSLRRAAESTAAREEAAELTRLRERVAALVPHLPERQAAAFVLRGFQGLSHREVAAVLECSEANSKSLFSLACARLRRLVEAEDARARATEAAQQQAAAAAHRLRQEGRR